jgi:hypothetical protein
MFVFLILCGFFDALRCLKFFFDSSVFLTSCLQVCGCCEESLFLQWFHLISIRKKVWHRATNIAFAGRSRDENVHGSILNTLNESTSGHHLGSSIQHFTALVLDIFWLDPFSIGSRWLNCWKRSMTQMRPWPFTLGFEFRSLQHLGLTALLSETLVASW